MACALENSWLTKLIELLGRQFTDVVATKATMLVWVKSELAAVIGISTKERPLAQARQIANEAAHNFRRILESEALRQEATANRHVVMDYHFPIFVIRSDGKIQAGSKTAWDVLYAHTRQRPSRKNPVTELPKALLNALPESGKATHGNLAITVYNLPGACEILLPLKVVLLESVEKAPVMTFQQKIDTLTPSQRAACHLVLRGYRDKEIAAELGITYNTSIHHVRLMLQKMGFGDRLQLMAAARQIPPRTLSVPDIMAVEPVPDLPLPRNRKTGFAAATPLTKGMDSHIAKGT